MTHKNPDILDITTVTQSRLFTVEQVRLRFSNNQERCYERTRGPSDSAVLIVPVLDDNTILLIREYGTGIGQYTLGFPKGAIDDGENVLAAANRELMEEVGYGANELRHIGKQSQSPGYVANMMDVVFARSLFEATLEGDEPEALEVIPWKLDNIDALLAHPEFIESRSIAALFLLTRELND